MRNACDVRLVISDVDGTLVNRNKQLTPAVVTAVRQLHDAGILFSMTSSRPPLGLKNLINALAVAQPVGAVNGAIFVTPDMSLVDQKLLPGEVAELVMETILDHNLDVWVYTAFEWFVRDPQAPHVARECHTVSFTPQVTPDLSPWLGQATKIVGVSDDVAAVAGCAAAVRQVCGASVSATCSQPYYLDVTHPDANKGAVVNALSQMLDIPTAQIATIGDGPNDVLMFAQSGFSIAMGNANAEVQGCAHCVTRSNEEDGFAFAMQQFILSHGAAAFRKAS